MVRVSYNPGSPKELIAIPHEDVQKILPQAELFVSRVNVFRSDLLADTDGTKGAESGA
jgi:hypothetical protein